ncbi:peptidase, M48 family protein [Roseobacter sp. SK209-2-6]|uniref:M48 family metalloprotease n=1 Tax=Roseobacter sp. SK209-2-6 TaxID=388739 RepID=UPI0000F3D50C|nr:M48 family metalloprotease [Roseobacter sp. SK209-2-6]EBA15868.1 peptidase, M48 family protein [Roseobacter sp. SK209-2-6]
MYRSLVKSTAIGMLALLSACGLPLDPLPEASVQQPSQSGSVQGFTPIEARQAFVTVKNRVEPVAERTCKSRTKGGNCNFLIRIDPDRSAPPNAYQTIDKTGRPVISFTQSILVRIANQDELAFVMAHEAAHHIRGHLFRQQQNAVAGAVLLGGLAGLAGGTAAEISNAQDLGAIVGARSYSKEFELEADALGTLITAHAGYQPSVGVKFFYRLPDPGDRFLGTHPANPERISVVNQTIARYGLN